ncbi:unnamed protein product [Sphagnum balticum]
MRLCGTRKTELLFATCSPIDKIYVSFSLTNPNSQSKNGFALLYHLLAKPVVTSTLPMITTNVEEVKTTTKAPKQSGHAGRIAGIVLGVIIPLLALIGFILYRRRLTASTGQTPQVLYQTGIDAVDSGLINGSKVQSSSIAVASLKNHTSLLNPVYPLYKKEKLKDHQPKDSSNA